MKNLLCLFCALIIFGVNTTAFPAQDQPLRYITEESTPDNYIENDVLKGVAVDLLKEVWKVMGIPRQPVKVLPWARAYREAQEVPNTVLFSIVRTSEREALFKWAGPIRTTRYVLIADSKTKLWLSSPRELNNYKIGTVIDDIAEKLLISNGVPLSRLDRSPSSTLNLEKFKNGRFDLLPYSETGIFKALKSQGMNPQNYLVVFTLSEKKIYYAFHKNIPDATVLEFQQALDEVRLNGTMDKILKRYDIIPLKNSIGSMNQ